MQTYFWISLGVALFGLLGAVANMICIIKGVWISQNSAIAHILFSVCWMIGGISSLVFGILWAIQHFSAQ
jgi:hypothetical protein